MVRFLKSSNIKKTIHYLKRNGIRKTVYAVLERTSSEKTAYIYDAPKEEALEEQKKYLFKTLYKFSILVPVYETKEVYLRELIDSVLAQTYKEFELILADAGKSGRAEQIAASYKDERIVYKKLEKNGGISENTNQALKAAAGDYIGLLDHDDILTKDALFEMAKAIEEGKQAGREILMLYSDEDKCNGEGTLFFEPHKKPDFNLDLLMSNNYICHFLVMKTEFMKSIGFRKEYDGAQDYDLVLRAVERLLKKHGYKVTKEEMVYHIPKVLYHWRCHEDSTAENPQSKQYAYEAGKHALEEFLAGMDWKAQVSHSDHVGFYHLKIANIFEDCGAVAAAGGKIRNRKNKITGGIYRKDGSTAFLGLPVSFSGYMHRASLMQTIYAADLRCMRVNPQMQGLFEKITGMKYTENPQDGMFLWEEYKKTDEEWKRLSISFCEAAAKEGYRIVFMPEYVHLIKSS